MKTPILIVNFKTYASATGKNAVKLAKAIEKASNETKKSVAIAVQAGDLYRVSKAVSIPVLAQHMDAELAGSNTGKIIAENIKANGAIGTLLNHSEDRYELKVLKNCIKRAKENKLITIVCANNDSIARTIARYEPEMIAVEPPELIGGNISISTAKPELITKTINKVHTIKKIPIIVGAGIKTPADVKIALKLGAKGILLASGITKAKNPYKTTKELLEAF